MKKKRESTPPPEVYGQQTGSVLDRVFGSTPAQDPVEAEDVSKIIKEWLDPKHVDKKTRYTPQQVIAVSILQSLADTYNITTLKRFLKQYKTAKLSEGGKSAQELENILKNRRAIEEDDSALSRLSKFLD